VDDIILSFDANCVIYIIFHEEKNKKQKTKEVILMKGVKLIFLTIILISFLLIINSSSKEYNFVNAQTDNGKASVYFNVFPSASSIYIDGSFKGLSPALVDVNEGLHTVTMSKQDYKNMTLVINVISGPTINVYTSLAEKTDNKDKGVIYIQSDVEASKVYIDGSLTGSAPVYTSAGTGIRTVMVFRKGYSRADQNVTVINNQTTFIAVNISSEVGSQESRGSIIINPDTPDLIIKIDNEVIGISPMNVYLKTGQHNLVLSKPGYPDLSQTINIESGKSINIKPSLLSQSSNLITQENDTKTPTLKPDVIVIPTSNNWMWYVAILIGIIILMLVIKNKKKK
jgi:hypothetical protein